MSSASAPSRVSLSLPLPLSPTPSTRSSLSPASDSYAENENRREPSDCSTALDRAVASVLLSPSAHSNSSGDGVAICPPSSSRRASLDHDCVVGFMVVHTKKPRKKLFTLHRSYYVVADTNKPVLEVYSSESRLEMVYLLSLVNANVDFETDNVSHAVRAKCFCLNVHNWTKRNTSYSRPQGFVFYLEDQAQMMVWVKCIHVAIRKASARIDQAQVHGQHQHQDQQQPHPQPMDHRFRDSDVSYATTAASEMPYDGDSDSGYSHCQYQEHHTVERETLHSYSGGEKAAVLVASAPPQPQPQPPSATVDVHLRRSPLKVRTLSRRRGVMDRISGGASSPKKTVGLRNTSNSSSSLSSSSFSSLSTKSVPQFGRLNSMFATMKGPTQRQLHATPEMVPSSDASSGASPAATPAATTTPMNEKQTAPSSKLMHGLHLPRGKSPAVRQVAGLSCSPMATSKRLSDPLQLRKKDKDDALFGGILPPFFSPRGPRSAPTTATVDSAIKPTSATTNKKKKTTKQSSDPSRQDGHPSVYPVSSPQPEGAETTSESDADMIPFLSDDPAAALMEQQTLELRLSSHLARLLFLLVSWGGGIFQLSVFLPLAATGVFVHIHAPHTDEYASAALAACCVYVTSSFQGSLGLSLILAIVYGWSYADFRTSRRLRLRRIADRLLQEENANFANVQFPNWVVRPDADRVDWLNKVLENGWPYMKIAIRNSLMDNLNPLLESTRPAFMSSLSLVRVDLGNKVPVISGVKYVSANTKTEEVTIDVDVRLVSDHSLTAELRMVSNVGAAAVVSLRDLFLAGTLRVTLNPMSTYWPCFSALNLCFTDRPAFDFSLTAAKINISNVPFASEWLQTFLHDLLMDYFVWPKVVTIPLWDETS